MLRKRMDFDPCSTGTPIRRPDAKRGRVDIPASPTPPAQPNRFLLVPLTAPGVPCRRSDNVHLNNLHISREQVAFELKPDAFGKILICMTNRGKNSTRVLSIARRKQARVTNSTYCRLVPGDVVELLYDQQGKYAFKLIETSPDGSPLMHATPLVPSVSQFVPPPPASSDAAGVQPPPPVVGVVSELMGAEGRPFIGDVVDIAGFKVLSHNLRESPDFVVPLPAGAEGGISVLPHFQVAAAHEKSSNPSPGGEGSDDADADAATTLDGLEGLAGLPVSVSHKDVPYHRSSIAGDDTGIAKLPGPLLGIVLSNLPLPDIIRAARVCKEWNREIRGGGNISLVDVGAYFAGITPPEPSVIHSIASTVRARDYSFANCMWLSTGALLHMIGVPVGATLSARLPHVEPMTTNATNVARESASWDVVNAIAASGVIEGGFQAGFRADAMNGQSSACLPPNGVISVARSSQEGGNEARAAVPIPRHSYLRYYLGELGEGSDVTTLRVVGEHSTDVPAATSTHTPEDGVNGHVTHSTDERGAVLLARNPQAWWNAIEDAVPFAYATTSAVLEASQLPVLPNNPTPPVLPRLASPCVSDAVVSEESLEQLRYAFPKSDAPAPAAGENPLNRGDWGSLSPKDLGHILVHSEVVRARAVSQYMRLLSTSQPGPPRPLDLSRPSSAAHGLIVARGYTEMSIACRVLLKQYKEAVARGEKDFSFLLSGNNIMDSLSIVGASTIFPPVADLRRTVAAAVGASADDGSTATASRAATVSAALFDSLNEHAAVHALSASYATAAADVFDFAISLAAARAGCTGTTMPHGLADSAICFELPTPAPLNATSGADFANAHKLGMLPNALGEPLLPFASSPVTGLDLSGCTRLAPQNLHLILSYCPRLTSLRLGGCSQFAADVLVSVAPLLKNVVYLDLEYCSLAVNDDVCAALGKHCPNLMRLQLVGCHDVSDAGLSEKGLFGVCTNLRRLNLRGCKNIGDAGIMSLAQKAPHLRELCLAGLTTVTAPALAALLASCKKLRRFKAELWYEGDAAGTVAADVIGETRRSFRLLGSVRSALRYLRTVLPPEHPHLPLLTARYAREGGKPLDGAADASVDAAFRESLKRGAADRRDSEDQDSLDLSYGYGIHARNIVDGDGPFAPTTNEVYMHQGGNSGGDSHVLPSLTNNVGGGSPQEVMREIDVIQSDHPPVMQLQHE